MSKYLLAIDQGTTSSRAILFDHKGEIAAMQQRPLSLKFPQDGWVEQDPIEIWETVLHVSREVIAQSGFQPDQIAAIGLTNQRETTLVWERATGKPIYPAIVWQDRRTADNCRKLNDRGEGQEVTRRSGLLLDPYFSASKLRWILDKVAGAQQRAERGELAFGTVDSWLIWCFNRGALHLTDATNASRTMLFNIHQQQWDPYLCELFQIPAALLPEVRDSAGEYGKANLLGCDIPILGVAGDQQAAAIGQGCFQPGMVKSTYGTGCFMLIHTGQEAVASQHRLLTTVAFRLAGKPSYALEGSIFMAGAAIQWLRDALGLIQDAAESETLAQSVLQRAAVYLVPAFTGLGAPYWDPDARGAFLGLTQETGRAHLVRATLEAVSYQTRDLMEAVLEEGLSLHCLRVDGGMVVNNWLMQHLADTLGVAVACPKVSETTALGAACLAGLQAGWFSSLQETTRLWSCKKSWQPQMDEQQRQQEYEGWRQAVARVRAQN